MEVHRNSTDLTSAKKLLPFSVVQCATSGPCEEQRVDAVVVSGSHNVFVRYEPADVYDGNTLARYRVVKGDIEDQMRVVASMSQIDGLQTLEISTTKKTIEVVLLQKHNVQRVVNEGSGDVTIMDQVVATMGPSLSIATVGSGDLFVASTGATRVDSLTLSSKGSGMVQAEFSEVHVSSIVAEYFSSGKIAVFSSADSSADSLMVAGEGSGSACLNWRSPFAITDLTVEQVGSGTVSIGPMGTCQQAKVSLESSGEIDIGGVQCDDVDVDLLGSGDVVLQAVNTLAGATYGSGDLKFRGRPPQSIQSSGYKQLSPKPVDSDYQPASCSPHKTPVLKSKAIGVSTGIFSPATPKSVNSAKGSASIVDDSDPSVIWGEVNRNQESILPLAVVVFIVAMALRWFNESRRRAREEQRQPLLGAQRRMYV